jgi:hypothetical protein
MLPRHLRHLYVIHVTATKVKSLSFSVSGFALLNIANNFIFIILYEFDLLSAWFRHSKIHLFLITGL